MYLVNLSQDKSKINSYLSDTLLEKIEESLNNDKKIILYLNKR
jgi:primosomal protein N'